MKTVVTTVVSSAVWKRFESNEKEAPHVYSAKLSASRPTGKIKRHITQLYVVLYVYKAVIANFGLTVE